MALSRTLLAFAMAVGGVVALVALILVPTLFIPVIFPLFKLYGESARIAAALAVTGFGSIPIHAYAISAVTGVLRSGGDVGWATVLDLAPQWGISLTATALCALVLKTGCWPIAVAMQLDNCLKVPLCAWRISGGKWIHDVTREREP